MATSVPFTSSKHESEILNMVRARGSCSISELADILRVSDETVRRHVQPLVEKDLVQRVHGGIVLPDQLLEAPYLRRMHENKEGKLRIARKAAELIHDNDSVFLDSGSTTAYVAQALANHRNLSVITNSVEIARILASHNKNRVYIGGGELRDGDVATFGHSMIQFINQFQFNHTILSVGGINSQNEILDFKLEEAEISQAAIGQSRQVTIVVDHTKFSRNALVRVCGLDQVDHFVTDKEPPVDFYQAAKINSTAIEVA